MGWGARGGMEEGSCWGGRLVILGFGVGIEIQGTHKESESAVRLDSTADGSQRYFISEMTMSCICSFNPNGA